METGAKRANLQVLSNLVLLVTRIRLLSISPSIVVDRVAYQWSMS